MLKIFIKFKCILINMKNRLRRKSHLVQLMDDGLFKIRDGNLSIYIARLNRHNRYKKGIMTGINMLANEYSLDELDIQDNGVLIECGANIGELSIWAKENSLKYIGFEPEEQESNCVKLNAENDSLMFRQALWNEKKTLTIYSLPNSGDSSVFDMGGATSKFEIDAVRLDEAVDLSNYTGTVILKVEAEGAEPEVLEGATGLFDQIDFITVDCGPERGVNQNYTFVEINNILVNNGFKLCRAKFERVTMLYYNESRSTCPVTVSET
jgi:FkbM family methyltransferase